MNFTIFLSLIRAVLWRFLLFLAMHAASGYSTLPFPLLQCEVFLVRLSISPCRAGCRVISSTSLHPRVYLLNHRLNFSSPISKWHRRILADRTREANQWWVSEWVIRVKVFRNEHLKAARTTSWNVERLANGNLETLAILLSPTSW